MSLLSKFSKTKTIILSELQVEILSNALKKRLVSIKEQKLDSFEEVENEYSVNSLINLLKVTPWNK